MYLWGWGNLWVSQRFDLDLSIAILKNPTYTVNTLENAILVVGSDDELTCVNRLLSFGPGYGMKLLLLSLFAGRVT